MPLLGLTAAWLAAPVPARAHNGPPFEIFEAAAAGPYTVTVSADPDVGKGTFSIALEPPPAADLTVTVSAVPLDGHRPAISAVALPGTATGLGTSQSLVAELPFDAEGLWRVTVQVGEAALSKAVPVTPEGPTELEALIYLLPFLFLGGALLWGWWSHRDEVAEAGRDPGP